MNENNYDVNLSGNFILNESKKTRKQFLLASQNYSTFYAIYAKVYFKKNTEVIDYIDFELVNYKGVLNMGFVSDKTSENNITVLKINEKLYIFIPVQPMSIFTKTSIHNSDFCDGKDIDVSDIESIITYKGILPMQKQESPTINSPIFDTEFNYRDGIKDTYPLKKVPGKYESLEKWNENYPRKGFNNTTTILAASENCRYSYMNVIKI